MRAVTSAMVVGVNPPETTCTGGVTPVTIAKLAPYRRPARRKTAPRPILHVGKLRRDVVRARRLRDARGRGLVRAARTLAGVR